MKKKLLKIVLMVIIAIFSIQLKVNAAVITSTDKEVESNSGTVTISVTSKQALGAYKITISDAAGLEVTGASGGQVTADKKTITGASSEGITELGSFTFKVPTVSSDTVYNIKFLVSGMETIDLDVIADENNTAVLKVKAQAQTTTPSTGNTQTNTPPTTTTPEETKKSSENKLRNFGIRPYDYDFSGFSKNPSKPDWSAEVPNSVTEVEIYGNAKDDKATVEGLGKVSLKEGNNTFEVKVTAEDGSTKTYTLTIKRQTAEETAKEASEARLSNLGIKPEEYDFSGFSKDKTEYTAEVPNDVEEIEVYATAVDSKAQITGIGMIELKEGENEIKVEVIAQNGEKKAYTIKVTRKAAETAEEPVETVDDEEKFGLSTLTITGITLNKKFNSETYEYTIDLTEDLTSLPISAKATDKDATVEIIGNENLQPGENIITILVQNAETEEVATYQIIVNKNVEEEAVRVSWLKPSTWGKEEIIKIAMVVVIIILIIIAVILKIQIAKESKKEKKKVVDFPGADALDKALAEHQELATEENNYIEEIAINSAIDMQQENAESEVAEEMQEAFSINEATKGEVKKFLEEFPQDETQEINENVESNEEETRVSVDDLFNNNDFDTRPKRRGRGKHF